MQNHPISRASLESFAAGTAKPQENRVIVTHLLQGCATCAGTLRELDRGKPAPDGAYERSLDRFERELRGSVTAPSGALTVLRDVVTRFGYRLLGEALVGHR
ncbi:MAG TPA: hypothetical protein VH394_17425 [Thermoanaerobaculia bacterium]|nr:hypothetical protein [Thermoanaerobaculia bacterium]